MDDRYNQITVIQRYGNPDIDVLLKQYIVTFPTRRSSDLRLHWLRVEKLSSTLPYDRR